MCRVTMKYLSAVMSWIFIRTVISSKEHCDKGCNFSKRFITAETLKDWPSSCEKVCGNVVIGAGNNVTASELKSTFNLLRSLIGNLTIEFTNLENLNFLSRQILFYSKSPESTVNITIRFNNNLTNISVIDLWLTDEAAYWNIYGNPKLDFEPFCKKDIHEWNLGFSVYGNLKDCGCNNVRVTTGYLPYYPNCTSIYGFPLNGLTITDLNDDADLSGFLKLEKISGVIEIRRTTLRNLSFLANLKTIDMSSSSAEDIILMMDNPKLKSLGFDSLKVLKPNEDRLSIFLADTHPKFCITVHEIQLFVDNKVEFNFVGPEPAICPSWIQNNEEKICEFVDLKAMEMGCRHIVGNVVVNSSNEYDAWKLDNVTIIYGSITVQNTYMVLNLSFLSNLEQVGATQYHGSRPLIQIEYNENLQTVFLPKLKRKFPLYVDHIIKIKSNAFNIFKNKTECLAFQKATKTVVEYNGSSCNKFKQINNPENGESPGFHVLGVAYVILTSSIWMCFQL